jgi:hypothetical protein
VTTLFDETYCKEVTELSCLIPMTTLNVAPYNLEWGTIVKAIVSATNLIGTTTLGLGLGGSAVMATPPDPPTDIASVPSATKIAVTWQAPSFDGGSSINDYSIIYEVDGGVTQTIAGIFDT